MEDAMNKPPLRLSNNVSSLVEGNAVSVFSAGSAFFPHPSAANLKMHSACTKNWLATIIKKLICAFVPLINDHNQFNSHITR